MSDSLSLFLSLSLSLSLSQLASETCSATRSPTCAMDSLLMIVRCFVRVCSAGGLIRHGMATYTNELDQFLAAEGAHPFLATTCKDQYGVFGDEPEEADYTAPAYRKGTAGKFTSTPRCW